MAFTKRRSSNAGEINDTNIVSGRTRNSPLKNPETEKQQPKASIQIGKQALKESELSGKKLFISKIQRQIPDWPDNDDVNAYNLYVWSTRKVILNIDNMFLEY